MVELLAAIALAFSDDPLLAPVGVCQTGTPQETMVCLTNYARTQSGLQALRANATLDAAGDAKLGADIKCGEFSHTPCGHPFESVFADYLAGAHGYSIGENIAWGTGSYGAARATMNSWLQSPGHRANILDGTFTEVGIGYLPNETFQGYGGATLWSQEFGTRSTPAPAGKTAPAPKPKAKPHHKRRRATRR
jgi:uncharacterized protein YkwD